MKGQASEKALGLDNGEIISAKVTDYHQHRHEPQTDGNAAIQEAAPQKEQKTLQCAIKHSESNGFIMKTARSTCIHYAIVIITQWWEWSVFKLALVPLLKKKKKLQSTAQHQWNGTKQ